MINIGKKTTIKDELNEYVKVNKDVIIEHYIYIEKVIIGETDEGKFAAVAGMDSTNNDSKVWFYAPTYDDSNLCNATVDDIEEITDNGYFYIVEKKDGKNNQTYYTGYIYKEDK